MLSPLVSVVMPCYNSEDFLNDAINSILDQSYKNIEFIIIDDGSTDRSRDIITSYTDQRIVYLENEENMGLIDTLNKGCSIANGKYIARFDSDDICLKSRIELQVSYMENHTDVGMVGMYADTINEHGKIQKKKYRPQIKHDDIIKSSCVFCQFIHPTVMIRKSILDDFSLNYSHKAKHAEDYFLWSQIAKVARVSNIDQVGLLYRIHSKSVSHRFNEDQVVNSSIARFQYLELSGFPISLKSTDMISKIFRKDVEVLDEATLNFLNDYIDFVSKHCSPYFSWRVCCLNAALGFYMLRKFINLTGKMEFKKFFLLTLLCLMKVQK
ncbi:Glycosyl transferase [Vibrio chagasii]|nr:Glycosyl transferase [Vibrio chagasii]CAH6896646.1 Glycosyl transferase [Vibrio chagasii]